MTVRMMFDYMDDRQIVSVVNYNAKGMSVLTDSVIRFKAFDDFDAELHEILSHMEVIKVASDAKSESIVFYVA